MTEHDRPKIYRVSISARARAKLLEFAAKTKSRGDGEQFLSAAANFLRRLEVYPQFGDPLVDLWKEPGHIRIGIIPPLSMRYAVLENSRLVFIASLPVLLPMASSSKDADDVHE